MWCGCAATITRRFTFAGLGAASSLYRCLLSRGVDIDAAVAGDDHALNPTCERLRSCSFSAARGSAVQLI